MLNDKIPVSELYKFNKKAAIRRIYRECSNPDTIPSVDSISQLYSDLSKLPDPINWNLCPEIIPATSTFVFSCPTPGEIICLLKKGKKKKSSPGIDKITYAELLSADPQGKILTMLFSLILETGYTPNIWRTGHTVLIPKAGELDFTDPTNWRPIALLNTTYKIFTSCLAYQLQFWIQENNILHRNQKSLAIHEGCVEHNFALNTMIENNSKNRLSAFICFIDIANVFPSVPFELLFGILSRHGVNPSSIQIISQLYENCENIIKINNTSIGPFPVRKSIRQGCPLSMLLFNVVINQVLLAVDPAQNSFKILAYADDLAITNTSFESLHTDVDTANKIIQWCGMCIKPSKCGLLCINPPLRFGKPTNQSTIPNQLNFTINGSQIPLVDEHSTPKYKYLGVMRGKEIRQNPTVVHEKCLEKLRLISRSALLPWQTLDAIKVFVHSKLVFHYRNYSHTRKFSCKV